MKLKLLILILSTLSIFSQGNQKAVITFNTIADMVARGNPRNPAANVVEVLGYNTAYDGGGGTFLATNTVTSTNLGTRLYSGITGWSWDRVMAGDVSIKMFGATDGGVATRAITNAITSLSGDLVRVRFPKGEYYFDSITNLTGKRLWFYGEGRIISTTNMAGPMIYSPTSDLKIEGLVLDGNRTNQASLTTNYYPIIQAANTDLKDVVFTNAFKYAFYTTNALKVVFENVKSFHQYPLSTNTTSANAAFVFAIDQTDARPEIHYQNVSVHGLPTTDRYPGGSYFAGSDAVNCFLRVYINGYFGSYIGDDHAIGLSHYGISFLDCYEDIELLHADNLQLTNSKYIGLKIQNTANAKISKAMIHTTGTVGLNYTPAERLQTPAYRNAQFSEITVYGDPARTYGFFFNSGDSGGLYNVSLDGFYGSDLFRIGEIEGFDSAGAVEGFGPVRLNNINGTAGSCLVVRGLGGDITLSDSDLYSTNGSTFVMTQTNSTAVVRLYGNTLTSDTGGNVTVRGVASLQASGNRLNAISGTALNLEDDASGTNIGEVIWTRDNKIVNGSVSITAADIDSGYSWIADVVTHYPIGWTLTLGNGSSTYIEDNTLNSSSLVLAKRFRNIAAGGGLQVGFGSDSALGTISIFSDTYSDATVADRFVIASQSTASGMTFRTVAGTTQHQIPNGQTWTLTRSGIPSVTVNSAGDVETPALYVNNDAFGPSWNGSTNVPTKDAIYDMFVGHTNAAAFSLGDMTTDILANTNRNYWVPLYDGTIVGVIGSVSTVSSSGVVTYDINLNGTSVMTTSKIVIDANETSTVTAATAPVLTTVNFSAGDKFTFDIDTPGTGAKGPQLGLYWKRR